MAIRTFAAIDVGSFEMAMKIYEISAKGGMREIDHVRHRLSLGYDSYKTHKIGFGKIDELCRVLREFQDIMASYHVSDYKAYGTSALRESENTIIILDQIRNRTGIDIEVLSNSEQR
ncbi:MAG: exopolyphosphatase, partial [Lachnospiraceae bacterium]